VADLPLCGIASWIGSGVSSGWLMTFQNAKQMRIARERKSTPSPKCFSACVLVINGNRLPLL
jgi:hypothetical protein